MLIQRKEYESNKVRSFFLFGFFLKDLLQLGDGSTIDFVGQLNDLFAFCRDFLHVV